MSEGGWAWGRTAEVVRTGPAPRWRIAPSRRPTTQGDLAVDRPSRRELQQSSPALTGFAPGVVRRGRTQSYADHSPMINVTAGALKERGFGAAPARLIEPQQGSASARDPNELETSISRSEERHDVSSHRNIDLARTLLEGIKAGRDLQDIDIRFAENVSVEVQGDDGVLPWIGHKVGRQAMSDMLRDQRDLLAPEALDVEDVLASDSRAVILGSLRTLVKATGKTNAGSFAIVLTIEDDEVTRYQVIEDSYDVAKAARR